MAKKMTIAERKAELEKQMLELEVLEDVQSQLNHWIKECDTNIARVFEYTVKVGDEEAQATNYKGELLYSVEGSWKRYTEAELIAEGKLDMATPSHDGIYETRTKSEEDLYDWEKREVTKWRKLKSLLQSLEV